MKATDILLTLRDDYQEKEYLFWDEHRSLAAEFAAAQKEAIDEAIELIGGDDGGARAQDGWSLCLGASEGGTDR